MNRMSSENAVPVAPNVSVVKSHGGALILKSTVELGPVFQSLPYMFDDTADRYPDRTFLCERVKDTGEWCSITYADAKLRSMRIAQGLISKGLAAGECVAILSAASIDHVLMMLATLRCGATISPISPPYSLSGAGYSKLVHCLSITEPRFVFADSLSQFLPAFEKVDNEGICFVVSKADLGSASSLNGELISLSELELNEPSALVHERTRDIDPANCARIMFTSGSTGFPKAVPQSHNCLTITVAQMKAIGLLDFNNGEVNHVEAMPFHHIMAGNFNFNNVVSVGGTIWLDDGKPTKDLFSKTIENLKEVSPSFYISVPAALAMLCDAMEHDDDLSQVFFKKLVYIGYGGAALSKETARKLQALAIVSVGRNIPIYSFYGATEFLFGTLKYWSDQHFDVIGLPLPGVELKLHPHDGRYELRVRGKTVLPRSGYLKSGLDIFDEEDFYKTGDVVRFKDHQKPTLGLVFQGRLSEEFKLSTGTWVSVNEVRVQLQEACDPYLGEVVICGENRDFLGGLLWISESAVEIYGREAVIEGLCSSIKQYNKSHPASSKKLARCLIMTSALSQSEGEVTDKGNANQRQVIKNRADDIDALYDVPLRADILIFE